MNRRKALQATGLVCLSSSLTGCIAGQVIGGENAKQTNGSNQNKSSKQKGPTLRKVVVVNDASEPKKIGIEVVQNSGNKVHTGYDELSPSKRRTLDRQWPPRPGEFSVVLHVPEDDKYDPVTFSTLDEHHDWSNDVKLVYTIRNDGTIDDAITEVSAGS